MTVLRTPEYRFEHLPDFRYQGNYLEVEPGLRLHYLDEGEKTNPTFLLLHGEPTWSYLYRKMIPVLVKGGCRVVALDLIGFGRSDKPAKKEDYSYQKHENWLRAAIEQLDLQKVRLFCQDWGGLLGMRLAVLMEERFSAVAASNTYLPMGIRPMPQAFLQWRQFSQTVPEFPLGGVLQMGTVTELPAEVLAAYEAPFPDESFKVGARVFPALVPLEFDDPEARKNRKLWELWARWEKPFLTLFGDSDLITKGADRVLQKHIPGARDQPHAIIEGAGHFSQEDQGKLIAEHLLTFNGSI